MQWLCGDFSFDTSIPVIMGILNVTPDSFSDGGAHNDVESACAYAHEMVEAGAAIIDVGGESTRPGAEPVTVEEELARVLPVVERLAADGLCVSIDTRHADVAAACLAAGASIINDVSGFRDPAMVKVAAASSCGVVIMHMAGEPQTMQDAPEYVDVVAEVRDYLRHQAAMLEAAGLAHDRICVDPGPGFGKTARQTLELVRNYQEFARLGYPVMVAISRKSFLGYAYGIENPLERDEVSADEALLACEAGATVVRTHNVALTAQKLKDVRPAVFISLGCNVPLVAEPGEELEGKRAMLNQAIAALCTIPDTQIIDISSFYESEPAYYLEQDTFLNAVALLRSGLPPKELLKYLQAIENSLGRVREIENGPRTMDLDIIDYQMYVTDNDLLTLPHPRALERDFVVEPLLELSPSHVLADGRRVAEAALPREKRVGKATRL